MKSLLSAGLLVLFAACAREESAPTPPAETAAAETQPAPAPPVASTAPPQTAGSLPPGSPIPSEGVLLWLSADDAVAAAKDGKLQTWTNALLPSASATAVQTDHLPAVVANAINGHAVVRFDGTNQMLMSGIDIGPARMPEGTVITVMRSATAAPSPLRKLYGNDNGGYDRAVGLDDRAAGRNYTLFNGMGVAGYFQLEADTTYIVVDEFSPKEFSGWVNGQNTVSKIPADWQDDALPNLYIGGTGSVFAEYWHGDLAEIIVYARKLTEAEHTQVESYLAQKYGLSIGTAPM